MNWRQEHPLKEREREVCAPRKPKGDEANIFNKGETGRPEKIPRGGKHYQKKRKHASGRGRIHMPSGKESQPR